MLGYYHCLFGEQFLTAAAHFCLVWSNLGEGGVGGSPEKVSITIYNIPFCICRVLFMLFKLLRLGIAPCLSIKQQRSAAEVLL